MMHCFKNVELHFSYSIFLPLLLFSFSHSFSIRLNNNKKDADEVSGVDESILLFLANKLEMSECFKLCVYLAMSSPDVVESRKKMSCNFRSPTEEGSTFDCMEMLEIWNTHILKITVNDEADRSFFGEDILKIGLRTECDRSDLENYVEQQISSRRSNDVKILHEEIEKHHHHNGSNEDDLVEDLNDMILDSTENVFQLIEEEDKSWVLKAQLIFTIVALVIFLILTTLILVSKNKKFANIKHFESSKNSTDRRGGQKQLLRNVNSSKSSMSSDSESDSES